MSHEVCGMGGMGLCPGNLRGPCIGADVMQLKPTWEVCPFVLMGIN